MSIIEAPYYPIVYVRGYAMTEAEIRETVATPYMGFNLGSTKRRQNWEGGVERYIFESPLVRLMKDHGYCDIYADGRERDDRLPARSIAIHRYYEPADPDLGAGKVPSVLEAAVGLKKLILRLREQVCGSDVAARTAFRVHLVAHSMGGLVCRCFLQNGTISSAADRAMVDKVYTYATPHNGIDMAGLNVPGFLGMMDLNNFNRGNMAEYLGLPAGSQRVDDLGGRFDPQRFFCLVGTNHKDYEVAGGLSSLLAGEMSDGLVRIENATVRDAPRAFVYRSHSGHYGIVNSEEGYQNLTRFLFGNLRVEGTLALDDLPLPPAVQRAHDDGQAVRASYYFEATVAPRGALTYKLSERRLETNSAILRRFDELFGPAAQRSPRLFSGFLDTRRIATGTTVVFTIELAVRTTGYEIDHKFRFDQHMPGEYLFRDTLVVRARQGANGWSLRYNLADQHWADGRGKEAAFDGANFVIPLSTRKGFKARLLLRALPWA